MRVIYAKDPESDRNFLKDRSQSDELTLWPDPVAQLWGEQWFWGACPFPPSSVSKPPCRASPPHDPGDVFLVHIAGYVTRDNCSLGS